MLLLMVLRRFLERVKTKLLSKLRLNLVIQRMMPKIRLHWVLHQHLEFKLIVNYLKVAQSCPMLSSMASKHQQKFLVPTEMVNHRVVPQFPTTSLTHLKWSKIHHQELNLRKSFHKVELSCLMLSLMDWKRQPKSLVLIEMVNHKVVLQYQIISLMDSKQLRIHHPELRLTKKVCLNLWHQCPTS